MTWFLINQIFPLPSFLEMPMHAYAQKYNYFMHLSYPCLGVYNSLTICPILWLFLLINLVKNHSVNRLICPEIICETMCCFSLFVMENWQVQEVQKMCEWINVASAVAIFVPRPANPRKENLWTLQQ